MALFPTFLLSDVLPPAGDQLSAEGVAFSRASLKQGQRTPAPRWAATRVPRSGSIVECNLFVWYDILSNKLRLTVQLDDGGATQW